MNFQEFKKKLDIVVKSFESLTNEKEKKEASDFIHEKFITQSEYYKLLYLMNK